MHARRSDLDVFDAKQYVYGWGEAMKRVLLGRPDGSRLYELTDEEFDRLEHLLGMVSPRARGAWTSRFLAERNPIAVYEPGTRGIPDEYRIDRAIGGNQFTPKWGQTTPRDPKDRTPE